MVAPASERTRTDLVVDVVLAALERRRVLIDHDPDVERIELIVKLAGPGRTPSVVLYRTESRQEIA